MNCEITVGGDGENAAVWRGKWYGRKSDWNDGSMAAAMFKHYCRLSKLPASRISGQQVTWWTDGERFQTYNPNVDPFNIPDRQTQAQNIIRRIAERKAEREADMAATIQKARRMYQRANPQPKPEIEF